MSKIGDEPILISKDIEVQIKENSIYIKGARGHLDLSFINVSVTLLNNKLIVTPLLSKKKNKFKNFHGLYRSLINNMVIGVTKGYSKELLLKGVGYKVNLEGDSLTFSLGFSHPVYKSIPSGLSVEVSGQNRNIKISGNDKNSVTLFASQIRRIRPPDPYLGKGIRYVDEIVKKKVGKANSK